MIDFGILGPMEVLHDGQPLVLGGYRPRTLLARLIIGAGRVVAADRLIDDVWDGDPPATARKTTQKYVSELRKVLPGPVLRTAGGGYVLDVDDDAVDARRFERLLEGGDVDGALALWRGDVLADLPGARFAAPERARLDELRLVALETRAARAVAEGRHAAAVAELSTLAEAHPLRERLVALLMVALYRSGRQVEALRAFETHRRRLGDDIGVEPAAELHDLEAAILRHDPALLDEPSDPAPAGADTHHPTPTADPPVGRSSGRSSVGVLPFVDLSPGYDQGYLCDGIAEELISALSAVDGLRVASRTASFRYRPADLDLPAIGAELGVTAVLEGSVRRHDDRLRIAVRLTSTTDGFLLWSASFDRDADDVFHIQEEIARQVADALALQIGSAATRQLRSVATSDLAAYDAYLQGRHQFYRGGRVSTVRAADLLRGAVRLAPDYAPPHAALADVSAFLLLYYDRDGAHAKAADHHSRRAVELDPELPEAHSSRGLALSASGAHDEAAQAFDTALELRPEQFDALYLYGRTCLASGNHPKAADLLDRASTARPDDFHALTLLGKVRRGLGELGRSRQAHQRALALIGHHLRVVPDDPRALCDGACALAELNQPDEARRWAERALVIDDPLTYYVACAYARLGDQRALDTLATVVDAGWAHLDWLRNDPDWAHHRHHPRYHAILDQLTHTRSEQPTERASRPKPKMNLPPSRSARR